jgi:hypothetical protein
MKICSCGKENYIHEDVCERCNKSILHINHEPFRFRDHILPTLSVVAAFIGFVKGVNYLEELSPSSIPIVYFQAIKITVASAILFVLLSNLYSSYQYDNPNRQKNKMSGEFFGFFCLNIAFILGIIIFVAFPDKDGVTLFPSLLFYLAILVTAITMTKDLQINKQKIVSWALVLSILSFEFFLIGNYAILIFAKYNLSPTLWWGIEICFFSLFFLFLGVFIGNIVAFCLIPPFKPYEFLNYLLWSNPKDVLLEIAFYGAIYVIFISPAIVRIINYLAST